MLVLGLWALCSLALPMALCFGDGEGDGDGEGSKSEPNYYSIYEAIDTLTTLTPHQTFYEFLGVSPQATDDDVSRAFRRNSVLYHPDKLRHTGKWDERTERLSKLLQFVGSLLRTEKGRRDYNWILNEAPAWHRQTHYVLRKFVPSSKLSIQQLVFVVLAFSIGLQFFAQWIMFAVAWYMIWSSRRAVKAMGEKEVKHLKRKMVGADPAFLTMTNSSYHTILLANGPAPHLPNPLALWVFTLPLWVARRLWPFGSPRTVSTVISNAATPPSPLKSSAAKKSE